MKKTVIKLSVFVMVFLVSLVVISRVMNRGNFNMTTVMSPASLPVVTMEKDGILYNELHGYTRAMDVAYQRDTITELGEDRGLSFVIDAYGIPVLSIHMEVRSVDGGRLIEEGAVDDIAVSGQQIYGSVVLKDLLQKDTEYSLTLILETDGREQVFYYTRIIWSENTYATEKLAFASEFHELLYSREKALEQGITKYLEPDETGDNTTFHKVNIHSSFQQITWGDLEVREVLAPSMRITELASQTGSIWLDYMVSTGQGEGTTYYMVKEFYRVRRVQGASRMYLLDYERTMTQIPDVYGEICANDKILLGIVDENLPFVESKDGNHIVFEVADRLYAYHVATNKMAVLFGFYDKENIDTRDLYSRHHIKVWDVDESGNVRFAVYGYMNRGRHEGDVGIQIYYYDSTLNMVEEVLFIPYEKGESVLASEMEQLLYLSRDNLLYLYLENAVYCVDITQGRSERLTLLAQDGCLQVSEDHQITVWQEGGDIYHSGQLLIRNLNSGTQAKISAPGDSYIMPLGFMGEDVVYGLARKEDVELDAVGRIFYPMYRIGISDSAGKTLKEFEHDRIYTVGCSMEGNQMILERVRKEEDGSYRETDPEYIMSNEVPSASQNTVVTAVIDIYEKYVQIQVKNEIDVKGIQIQTPREVVFEGSRNLETVEEDGIPSYYVYGKDGIDGIFVDPAKAVACAYEESGSVVDDSGRCIWIKSNRATRNQIMAIGAKSAGEGQGSLAVCLDTVLQLEGVYRNSQSLLDEGMDVMEILESGLEDAKVLDLTGCSLDAVLYFVNRDIPVLAILENGEAVLVTGFNELNVVVMEPATGRLYRKGMKDSASWFEENGNCFITYVRESD